MLLWPGFLAAATMHTRPIILSPDLVSVPRVNRCKHLFMHWAPTMAHVSELQVQPSPLCWPQGIIVFRERCIPPCLFFMETTTKNPEMKKKMHRLFKYNYCYYHFCHHQMFSPMLSTRCDCSQVLFHILLEPTMGFHLLESCKEQPT